MVAGDLTASTPVYVDMNDDALIVTTIDALNLALATDTLFVVPMNAQKTFAIFKVEREA